METKTRKREKVASPKMDFDTFTARVNNVPAPSYKVFNPCLTNRPGTT